MDSHEPLSLNLNMTSSFISPSTTFSGPSRPPSSSPSHQTQSPPTPHRSLPKSSLFSRLRRTAIPIPMSVASHLVQADSIATSLPHHPSLQEIGMSEPREKLLRRLRRLYPLNRCRVRCSRMRSWTRLSGNGSERCRQLG